ncbi:MAG: DUF1289 domain-containing protein [Gammaproteobacteria bacterium]|nr:hypothetical protein [Gammaproteobacteria bacterium]
MTLEPALQRVVSPCIMVCPLDQNGICIGCGRAREDIAAWRRSRPDAQPAIRGATAERSERVKVRECKPNPSLTVVEVFHPWTSSNASSRSSHPIRSCST